MKRLLPCLLATLAAAQLAFAAVPGEMLAAAIDHAGGPEALTLRHLPVPQPAPDEVLVELHAAGVAPWDAAVRQDPAALYGKRASYPLVLGTDGAGIVAAVGSTVRGFHVGDAVYAYSWANPQGGFYAEYAAVPAARLAHLPRGFDMLQAGAMGTTALTALQGIDDALHLKRGEAVLIHGASGGVGTLAIQFAKLRGARVLATASGDEGVALARRLGADEVVDGRSGDVAAAARRFAPAGMDAVLGLAGGDALERCLATLRPGGRAAYPEGVEPPPPQRTGLRLIAYNAVPGPREYARLNEAIRASHVAVPIAAEFPLAEAPRALARVEAGHLAGKVVLRIR